MPTKQNAPWRHLILKMKFYVKNGMGISEVVL